MTETGPALAHGDVRTVCKLCGKQFRSLGGHMWRGHGITARDYKRQMGLRLDLPLTDDELQEAQRQNGLAHTTPERMSELRAAAELVFREQATRHNMSAEERARLAARNRILFERKCRRCDGTFWGRSARRLCDACRDAAAVQRAQPRGG